MSDGNKCGNKSCSKQNSLYPGTCTYYEEVSKCRDSKEWPEAPSKSDSSGSNRFALLNAKANKEVGFTLQTLIETINQENYYKAHVIAKRLSRELCDMWTVE